MVGPLNRRTRARARVMVAAVGLALSVFGTVVFTSASGSPSTPGTQARAAAVAPTERFALLRKPQGQSPPSNLVAAVHRAPAQYGLQVADARYAASSGAWLIPGAGWLCIATTDSEGLGMSCATAASAEAGTLAFVVRESQGDGATVVGAAPDGESEAVARTSDGTVVAGGAVGENTYRLVGDRIASTTLNGPSGTLGTADGG
jgi:hypothetical protein